MSEIKRTDSNNIMGGIYYVRDKITQYFVSSISIQFPFKAKNPEITAISESSNRNQGAFETPNS